MRRLIFKLICGLFILIVLSAGMADATAVTGKTSVEQDRKWFILENGKIRCVITFEKDILVLERLEIPVNPAEPGKTVAVESDGDFALDVQWTDWAAPGQVENGANPILLTGKSFKLSESRFDGQADGSRELVLVLTGLHPDNSLTASLTYRLSSDASHLRRRLAVRDEKASHHFLRWLWPRRGVIHNKMEILKKGGFGLPLALLTGPGGAFFGMEYPAAENALEPLANGGTAIRTGQERGERIGKEWITSDWSVSGLTPDPHVKLAFDQYLDSDVRVAPLKPYLLYNTWYDVRAPEYVDRPEDVMNETNLLRIINDFKREMFDKRGLKLDAFVLDDGWDIYKSDWELRKTEFPNGLKPLTDALKTMGTDLGIWFGPIGGYSHRNWRVDWMKAKGYEAEGDQLCLAGKNYLNLFRRRNTDFVTKDNVAYFKWDGIQFSCSEPDHGHPVDIYSRRAVMEATADLCRSVRAANPNVFLNITSGTWLSPWWLKYADIIWMQGEDYGWANTPSISRRDAAMTYRDLVLYEDFRIHHYWFPLANLMTHGVIKGHLQKLGGDNEPLDKFSNSVAFYFARGVTMYELYISPNLLTDGEWEALGRSIRWARDRFDLLKQTEMIGGDPGAREAYGYVHFKGKRGVVAARNPFIEPKTLRVELDPGKGMERTASSLVLERIYPSRWISPRLYAAGAALDIPLDGYETAIYELYPLEEAAEPLFAGAEFDVITENGTEYALSVRNIQPDARLLNPETVAGITLDGESIPLRRLSFPPSSLPVPASGNAPRIVKQGVALDARLEAGAQSGEICLLLEPSDAVKTYVRREQEKRRKAAKDSKQAVKGDFFRLTLKRDGKTGATTGEGGEGTWTWRTAPLTPGQSHSCVVTVEALQKEIAWSGAVSAYIVYRTRDTGRQLVFTTAAPLAPRRPLPAPQLPRGVDSGVVSLGKIEFKQN